MFHVKQNTSLLYTSRFHVKHPYLLPYQHIICGGFVFYARHQYRLNYMNLSLVIYRSLFA